MIKVIGEVMVLIILAYVLTELSFALGEFVEECKRLKRWIISNLVEVNLN